MCIGLPGVHDSYFYCACMRGDEMRVTYLYNNMLCAIHDLVFINQWFVLRQVVAGKYSSTTSYSGMSARSSK